MKRVLANDGLPQEGIDIFNEAGIEVDTEKKSPEDLLDVIKEFDGLLVRSATKVTRPVMEAGKNRLKIIGRSGVGYDNVDLDAASENGVVVKYAPHGNTNATAELALALMFVVSRNIPQAYSDLRHGRWVKKPYEGVELSGKVLGVIGCGRIGQRLSELVPYMRVVGFDIRQNPESRIEYMDSIEDLLRVSDYVSIHTGGNEVIIDASRLGLMKSSAILINASRGKNVDQAALREALETGRIAGAGIDVYVGEGKEGQEFHHPYEGLTNVVVTPHLGASTAEAQKKTAIEIAEKVSSYLLTGEWGGSVNASEEVASEGKPIYTLFITHMDKPGMFGAIDTVLGDHGVNIRDNPSRKLGKDSRVQTVYQLHQPPTDELIRALRAVDGVYFVKR